MNLVFFDSNFLFYSKSRFTSSLVNKIKESGYEIFTSEIVVMEGKNKNIRDISNLYKKYKSFMDDDKLKIYIDLNDHTKFDEDKVKDESNKRIDAYIKEYFGENVISSVEDAQIGKILFDRSQLKKAPFFDTENSSDKGWKDTLIWVSFMNYCIGKDYERFYFVTKDNGFINQQDRLKEEFANVVGKPILFVNVESFEDLFLSLDIVKKEKKSDIQIPEEVVNDIISSIDGFVEFDEVYNSFGNVRKSNAFSFTEKPNLEEIEQFCNYLNDNETSFVFMKSVDLSDIVSKCFHSASTNCVFALDEIRPFLKSWNTILKNYPSYKAPFLKALEARFISMVQAKNQTTDFDDLPF